MAKKNTNTTPRLNEVFLRGKISHVYGSERGGSLTVPYSVPARKPVRDEEGNVTFVDSANTFFPEALYNQYTVTKEIIQDFNKNDNVIIKGYLGSYATPSGTGYDEHTVLFIDTVEHDHTQMEQLLGVPGFGSRYATPTCEVRVEAKIIGITKRYDTIYELRLECEKDGRTYPVTAMYYRSPRNLENDFHMNDIVYVIGTMESARNEFRGKIYFLQTFVIQEMVKQSDVLNAYNRMRKEQEKAQSAQRERDAAERAKANATAYEESVTQDEAEAIAEEEAVASETEAYESSDSYEETEDIQEADSERAETEENGANE
ncbi:hypothetical protein [Clostridium fessum]|uniref:hypothetical protein n=1 Tax=Clostridium fessum TaxID=2126740 RepID=UPI0022E60E92|nr:hypothetical protein [Clostridium fessum]